MLYPFLQTFHKPKASGFTLAYNPCVEVLWITPHNIMSRHCALSVLVKMPPRVKRLASLSYLAATTWPCINEAETVPVCPASPADEMQATAPGHATPRCADLHRSGESWAYLSGSFCSPTRLLHCGVRRPVRTAAFSVTVLVIHFLTLHGQPCVMSLSRLMVKGTGCWSAQATLFPSQLPGDRLPPPQLQSLIIPYYCMKFHPFTDSFTSSPESPASFFILEAAPVLYFHPLYILTQINQKSGVSGVTAGIGAWILFPLVCSILNWSKDPTQQTDILSYTLQKIEVFTGNF